VSKTTDNYEVSNASVELVLNDPDLLGEQIGAETHHEHVWTGYASLGVEKLKKNMLRKLIYNTFCLFICLWILALIIP